MPDKTLTEDIIKVGPGGNFLARKSTRNLARSGETYLTSLLDRHTLEQWLEIGKPGMYSRARQKVGEILAGPLEDPLPEVAREEQCVRPVTA